jgi:hypothetical protein
VHATLTHNKNAAAPRLPGTPGGLRIAVLLGLSLLTAVWMLSTSGDPPTAEPAPLPSESARPVPAMASQPAAPATAGNPRPLPASPDAAPVAAGGEAVGATLAVQSAVASREEPGRDMVLFLTIIGDQTYYQWGWAGDRPPRIDSLAGSGGPASAANPVLYAAADVSFDSETSYPELYGGVERPYGPEPQECPRTLPAGSTQGTADSLRSQAGCRYLSTCSAETEECTWHYQGRDRLTPT